MKIIVMTKNARKDGFLRAPEFDFRHETKARTPFTIVF